MNGLLIPTGREKYPNILKFLIILSRNVRLLWGEYQHLANTKPTAQLSSLTYPSLSAEQTHAYTYDDNGTPYYIYPSENTYGSTLLTINPIMYRGYVFDRELGMYYLQSRYYIPQIARFLNADGLVSTGQGILGNNMFAYCGNNPVCRSNPSGYIFFHVARKTSPAIKRFCDTDKLKDMVKDKIDAAIDFLSTWLTGDGSFCCFLDGTPIVEALQTSPKMGKIVQRAIDRYETQGIAYSYGHGEEFTLEEDGANLYLSTQHFNYSISVSTQYRAGNLWGLKYKAQRSVATVMVYDTYDFDPKAWNSAGNALNNIAYYFNAYGGIGNDFDWTAVYTYEARWLCQVSF